MDQKVLSVGERLTIRMIANKLRQVYGEGFLLENELINGCYQLLASHAALAERLKALESAWLECEGIHAKGLEPTIKGVEALITERDTLAEKLKVCEAERDHQWKMAFEKSFNDPVLSFKRNALRTPEEFVKEIERLFLKYARKVCEALEAERDTLKAENARLADCYGQEVRKRQLVDLPTIERLQAENTRLRELLNEILEHDGSRAAFHAFKLYEARRKAEAALMAAVKEQP